MMAENGNQLKRKISLDGSVSPPLLRRKVQSSTTRKFSVQQDLFSRNYQAHICIETAVASFFTPASQKTPEKTLWSERAPNNDTPSTLLVGRYVKEDPLRPTIPVRGEKPKTKIAAFDFVRAVHNLKPEDLSLIDVLGFYIDSDVVWQEICI